MSESQEPGRIPGGRVTRVAPLVGLAGRTAGEAAAASLRRRRHGGDLTDFHTRQAQRYVEQLGRSRGVLMKAGQMLSFVAVDPCADAAGRGIYQAAFARLQDDAPPMPARTAIATVTSELGRPPQELFAQFDPHPLAAASIGQVHAARLHDGRAVAVKVQYPGVEEAIRADLANTELVATFLKVALTAMPGLGRFDVRAMAQEISERIAEEVDYRIEAANQQEFAEAHRGHPFIRIPEILPELSTRRVLTMDLVEGMRYAKALTAEQSLRDLWGEAIYRFVQGNLSLRGLLNADADPGNYLFHPDGTVTFLDFGCVKRFGPDQIRCWQDVLRASIDRDAQGLLRAGLAGGSFDPAHAPDAEALLAFQLESFQALVAPQPFTYTPDYIAAAMRRASSPRGPHRPVLRSISGGADYTCISRVETGMSAVLGGLHATGCWRAIREEYFGGPPATPYGEAETTYRRTRP